MKIKNLNTKYSHQRLPVAGEIWKGKPWIGGVWLIVETGNYLDADFTTKIPSKLTAVNLEYNSDKLGTYEGADLLDLSNFAQAHDFVCHASKVKLVFPKKK